MSPFYLRVIRILFSLIRFNGDNNVNWLNSRHFKTSVEEGYVKAILRHLKVAFEYVRHSSEARLHDFSKREMWS